MTTRDHLFQVVSTDRALRQQYFRHSTTVCVLVRQSTAPPSVQIASTMFSAHLMISGPVRTLE